MRLIGLNGRRGSGKDQTFQYIDALCRESGYVAQRVAFADKLKISAMRALGFDGPDDECIRLADLIKCEGSVIDTSYDAGLRRHGFHISGRLFLQRYGTEAHRDVFGTDFWVDAVLPTPGGNKLDSQLRLADRYPEVDVLVVTDVRFDNEAQRVLDLGGEVWEIVRWSDPRDAHASEQPLSEGLVTRTIANDGNLSVLFNRTAEALTT